MAHNTEDIAWFYIRLQHFGLSAGIARIAAAVAFAATGIDLDYSGYGHCTAFYLPNDQVTAHGIGFSGPFSEQTTVTLWNEVCNGGHDLRYCAVAYFNPPANLGAHPLRGIQQGSDAWNVLPQVDTAIKGATLGGTIYRGLGGANEGWKTFQTFATSWAQSEFIQLGAAAAAIRRATQ
jgi:hypothetical protein